MEKRLSMLAIFLSVILASQGAADDPYFLERKKSLQNAMVTFYPQAKGSKIDKRHYANSAPVPHDYKLIINEADICSQHHKVFLLVLIRGYYPNFQQRLINREQLEHRSQLLDRRGLIVKHVFLFGTPSDLSVMRLIKQESDDHHDIIQEDFIESYVNTSLTVPMGYKWAVNYCPNAEYVMVGDEQLSYDVDKIVSFLLNDHERGPYYDHFAICSPIGNGLAMRATNPRFIGLDRKVLYQGNFYPSYCRGLSYAAHIYVINKLYRATLITPSFMPSDVWIGVMSEKLRLKTPNHQRLFVEKDLKAYFANPKYPALPGAIAVINSGDYKGHELETLESIMNSMKNQWKKNQLPPDDLYQEDKMVKMEDKGVKIKDSGVKVDKWVGNGVEIGKGEHKSVKMDKRKYLGAKMDKGRKKQEKKDKGKNKGIKKDKQMDKWKDGNIKIDKGKDNGVKIDKGKDNGVKIDKGKDNGVKVDKGKEIRVKVDEGKGNGVNADKGKEIRVKVDKGKDIGVNVDKGKDIGVKVDKGKDIRVNVDKGKDIGVNVDKVKDKQDRTGKVADNGVKIGKEKDSGVKTDKKKDKGNKMDKRKYKRVKIKKRKYKQVKMDKTFHMNHVYGVDNSEYSHIVNSMHGSRYAYILVGIGFLIILSLRKQILNILAKCYYVFFARNK